MRNPMRFVADLVKRIRFSLATLILLLLTLAAAATVWVNRHPWTLVRNLKLPSVEFSIDGLSDSDEMLVRPWEGGEPFVWHSESGLRKPLPYLPAGGETIVAVASQRRLLATIDFNGTLRIRDLNTGTVQNELEAPSIRIPPPCFSLDNHALAWLGTDGGIRYCNLDRNTTLKLGDLDGSTTYPRLELSGDGRYLQVYESGPVQKGQTRTDDCIAWRVFDCSTAQLIEPPDEFRSLTHQEGRTISFKGSADRLYSGDRSWVVGSKEVLVCPGFVSDMEIERSSEFVAFRTRVDGVVVRTHDLQKTQGEAHHGLKEHGVGFIPSPDGQRLVSGGYCACWCDRPSAVVWDLQSGQALFSVPNVFYASHFTRNGTRIVGTTMRGDIQVWEERWTENSWGIWGRPETWLALILLVATLLSIRRDRRMGRNTHETKSGLASPDPSPGDPDL